MTFSVVTPSYNQLDMLVRAVASVKDQAKKDSLQVEHFVQDAGSQGIENFAREHEAAGENYRLRIFSEKDEGMYDAINRGLKKTSGELCSYLNCDEQYLPGTLARVAEFFRKNPGIDVVFGDAILIDAEGNALSYRRAVLPDRLHTRLVHLNVLTCSTFFRRSIVDKGFLFDPRWKIVGDAAWVDSMLEAGLPMAVMPEPLTVFTFTGANLSEGGRSIEEQKRWVPRNGLANLARLFAILRHRWKKWLAGSYARRNLNYEIYTESNPRLRASFRKEDVGYSWPQSRG